MISELCLSCQEVHGKNPSHPSWLALSLTSVNLLPVPSAEAMDSKGLSCRRKVSGIFKNYRTELRQERGKMWEGGESEVSQCDWNLGSMEEGAPIRP